MSKWKYFYFGMGVLILIVGVNNKDFWTLVFGGIFILLGVIAR
jgi:hypothetical protein